MGTKQSQTGEEKGRQSQTIKRLTDKTLKKLKPREKWYRVLVGDKPGLSLRVQPSGNIIFRYRYQIKGRRREISVGSFPSSSLKDLNAKYAAYVAQVGKGEDPLKNADGLLTEPTVKNFAAEYLANCEARHLAPSTLKEYRRIFDKYIIPKLGRGKVSELRRRDLSALINYIATQMKNEYAGRITKGAPTQASRVLAVLSGFCRYAVERELLEYNPAIGIKKPGTVNARDRYLTLQEIKTAHDVIREQASREIYEAFMLALLTGQRVSQIAALRLDYIKGDDLEFPAAAMKSGRPHTIPLSPTAKKIIEGRQVDGLAGKYLFPGATGNPHIHADSLKHGLRRRMESLAAAGVPHFSFHDLRRTLATHINKLGFRGLDRAILGHAATGVTEVHYNRYDLHAEIKTALNTWDLTLERTIHGTAGADVLPLAKTGSGPDAAAELEPRAAAH